MTWARPLSGASSTTVLPCARADSKSLASRLSSDRMSRASTSLGNCSTSRRYCSAAASVAPSSSSRRAIVARASRCRGSSSKTLRSSTLARATSPLSMRARAFWKCASARSSAESHAARNRASAAQPANARTRAETDRELMEPSSFGGIIAGVIANFHIASPCHRAGNRRCGSRFRAWAPNLSTVVSHAHGLPASQPARDLKNHSMRAMAGAERHGCRSVVQVCQGARQHPVPRMTTTTVRASVATSSLSDNSAA
ncbi:MAG: hypothetical protein HLUCCA09_00050 [Rhodobacteraceae bacterium HLUCCA09]|nr:MAG: hypothetical protein HLUCCA09_00050 [Rhodobacteraceae bacterium HLUCCA09]